MFGSEGSVHIVVIFTSAPASAKGPLLQRNLELCGRALRRSPGPL